MYMYDYYDEYTLVDMSVRNVFSGNTLVYSFEKLPSAP